MESGPGAEEVEELERASETSVCSRGSTPAYGWREVLICDGVAAPGMAAKREADLPRANFLAFHMVLGVASRRKERQRAFFATLMALKYPFLVDRATSTSS